MTKDKVGRKRPGELAVPNSVFKGTNEAGATEEVKTNEIYINNVKSNKLSHLDKK